LGFCGWLKEAQAPEVFGLLGNQQALSIAPPPFSQTAETTSSVVNIIFNSSVTQRSERKWRGRILRPELVRVREANKDEIIENTERKNPAAMPVVDFG